MNLRTVLIALLSVLALQALVLYLFGQPPICACGDIKFWEGVVLSSGNSQHLTDWYTFSHLIHGMLFYAFLWFAFPRMSIGWRIVLALGLETAWEIMENTPWVINAYREQALAQGYTGDSIINSISDSLAMLIGFVAAWRFPTWVIVLLILAMEIGVGYLIHDNLALNILNFIHPFDFITAWQTP